MSNRILLIMPPFFTPWTPPLGIAVLKSFLEQHGYSVTCLDFNTDPGLWGTHHQYFAALQQLQDLSINDGYSKLWPILNAHMLAYANGADHATCSRILDLIAPTHEIMYNSDITRSLISIVEAYFARLVELIDCLDLLDFETVGTSTYTTSLASSLFILKKIKQRHPHIVTVMGGGVFADDLAPGSDNLKTLLEECPFVDHIVVGEGEHLFLKLLRGELSNKRIASIADIGGTTLDLSKSCIPDFSDLDLEFYYHLSIEGGRSCPFQCRFCSETLQWGKYRKKPADVFVEQLVDLAQKYGNNTFLLADSLMNPYIIEFSHELIRREAHILYDGYLRADKLVTDRNRVRLWARSGLYRARLGVESGSARVLNLMDKGTTPEIVSEALISLASAGIRTTTYWVVGFPGETEADFQRTLDFIREHHRYIYELEAHPYCYHPHGQVGSGLYTGCSLYPEDVNRVIKFRQWEIKDRRPTRRETYDRLKRISRFAAELGLPNMYTMTERYQAENRWHLLHPLAHEVYEGTRIHRGRTHLSQYPVPVFSQEWRQQTAEGISNTASILCYHVLVKKNLDETTLSASIDQLIQNNDVLQVRFHEGEYVPTPEEAEHQGNKIVFVYPRRAEHVTEIDITRRRIIERLSAEMRPGRGGSIRVALIETGQQSCDILVLVHRAVADGKGVVLLLEDLFRIYEQLYEGKEISLRPVQKTYTQLISELAAKSVSIKREFPPRDLSSRLGAQGGSVIDGQAGAENWKTKTVAVLFEKSPVRGMLSEILVECDLTKTEVLVNGFLQSLVKARGRENIGVDVTVDCRTFVRDLEDTVGVLMHTVQLSPKDVGDNGLSDLFEIRRVLRRIPWDNVEPEAPWSQSAAEKRWVLLNFEYLVDEPWLGGDEWVPQGFVVDESGPRGTYVLEIVPILSNSCIKIRFKYQDRSDVEELVEAIAGCLTQEVEAILEDCERYVAAKRFCQQEFCQDALESSIGIERDAHRITDRGWALTRCGVKESVLNRLQLDCQADLPDVILAAYSVLLSRLNGLQDMAIISAIRGKGVFPLRVYPSWDMGFREFVQNVRYKITQAAEHHLYAFHVLTNPLQMMGRDILCPAFDVGYEFCDLEQEREGTGLGETLELYPTIGKEMALILEVVENKGDVDVRFSYRQSLLGQEIVRELVSCLLIILEEASKDPDVPLGDIALGSAEEKHSWATNIATDANFNF
ncbi:MAG: radical SAM protein [Chloroflexi bacterium]|nr:radical SAM protein [Chloroflexota bacterium]